MVWHDSQHQGSQIHISEEILFPCRDGEQEKRFWGSHDSGECELSHKQAQTCQYSPVVSFEPSFPPLRSKGQLISSQQAPQKLLRKQRSQGEHTVQCCTKRFSYVTYMRILTTHKCSYNSKLLSHFSIFMPESARTLQRQMGPREQCSAGSSACRYHLKHRLRADLLGGLVESVNSHTGEKPKVTHATAWKIW